MVSTIEKLDAEIQNLLNEKKAFPASVGSPVAQYIYNLVTDMKPDIFVEVGCCYGFSALHITKAMSVNGKGKLISFDLNTELARQRLEHAGVLDKVDLIQGNSATEGSRYFSRINKPIDILFIDGDHTRRGCLRDAATFLPFLKVGGILILHDIFPEHCGWRGPRYLIDRIKRFEASSGNSLFTIEEISSLDKYGIAVCVKIADISPKCYLNNVYFNYCTSRFSQLLEMAHYERKQTPWQILLWGLSKWRRIGSHW